MVKEHEDIVLVATLATPSAATVSWLKDGVEIRRSQRHVIASQGDTHTLTVHSAQVLDSAVYSCRAGDRGEDFAVQVQGEHRCGERGRWWVWGRSPLKPALPTEVATMFLRPLEPVSGELGGSVTLACELSVPQAPVAWRCGDIQLRPGRRFQMEATGPLRTLTVLGLRAEDAGEYVCETRDDRTSTHLSVHGRHRGAGQGGRCLSWAPSRSAQAYLPAYPQCPVWSSSHLG